MVYLDFAANTPVDDEVLDTFIEATKKYIANPNSSHILGQEAKNEIDRCSKVIANYFNTDKENIIYTSGATESNNLVLKGIAERNKDKGNHIIISTVEHSSIIAPCNYLSSLGYDVSVIGLNSNGQIDLEELKNTINDKTILVSICSVDSEVGTFQPINEIGKIVKEYPNCVFHTDATQAIGKIELDYSNVDFITFAPHKFYGLNGTGVLVNKNNIKLVPLIHGGKSTTIYRSGTPVTANIIALEKAFTKAISNLNTREIYTKKINNMLKEELEKYDFIHINSTNNCINTTLNISIVEKNTKNILKELENNNIFVSTKAACTMEGMPSKSVLAITNNQELASNTIRISFSHNTTEEEIKYFLNKFIEITSGN